MIQIFEMTFTIKYEKSNNDENIVMYCVNDTGRVKIFGKYKKKTKKMMSEYQQEQLLIFTPLA